MGITSNLSLLNANTLELHYGFKDKTHTMDAFVQNKCEHEFLAILKEIASVYDAEIVIETEPFGEGGLRRWFKIISKEESKKATITIAVIAAVATVIITTPITGVSERLLDKLFEDKELIDLEKEKLILEIEILRKEVQEKDSVFSQNTIIKKRKSNFYETLEKYQKVEKVSFVINNENKDYLIKEKCIERSDFKNFILVSDELEPGEIEEAVIEIISPVLKKGAYKWMGIYNDTVVPFNMLSNEFKTLVQTGGIEFKNGSSINCFLRIRKRIDNEGLTKIVGYDVLRVNYYFENDKPVETPEGRFHRQKKEADKRQMRMFNDQI
jgi:hypothetical protein